MSASFVMQLRTGDDTLNLGDAGGDRITLKAQMAEVWDVVRIESGSFATVNEVKVAALGALFPDYIDPSAFLVKLNGLEVHDEDVTLAAAGARTGSTLLVSFRKKRPVR